MSDGKELIAAWMMREGFATGHGDTAEELLEELSWQVAEIKARQDELEGTMRERDRAICVSELLEEALDRAEMIEDQVGALFAALTYLHGVDSGQIPEENRDSAMRMAESCINKIVRQGGVNFPSYRLRREALEREAGE